VSWTTLLVIAAGSYLLKALGLVVFGGRHLTGRAHAVLDLLPAALLPALVAINTFATGRHLVLDARAVGVAVAGVATWRRWPFPVVIALAAAVTAGVRQLS
jgi:uncharacterized membrane protein